MQENTLEMVQTAAATALSRRARNAVILDLRQLPSFTNFFVICSGASDTQVEGISDAVRDELADNWNERPWRREGDRHADWVLLDYVDFVVHIFLEDKREYYNLERLWADAPQIEVPDVEAITEYEEDEEVYDELEDYDFDDESLFPSQPSEEK
jgi:ribosome-associated protein